ncbi:MAG: PAS domain-containing protein [Nitrospirae bacterium]|nr:PAS domain-containing protein [Nitrospirota bacterium]
MEHILEEDISKLLEVKRFLQSIIDSIEDQIMVVDREYRILEVNEALLKRLNKPKHEIIGEFCYKVLHDLDRPCNIPNHPCPVQETLKTGKASEALHTHFKGREVTYYRVTSYPIFDAEGVVQHVVEMARDVTKWKKAGEKMHTMQKLAALGELAAGVAHELNNPVAIILGFVDLLIEKTKPDSKEYKMLKSIERQGLNCKKIIENFLSLTTYQVTGEYSADVNANIERVISVLGNILLTKNIIVEKNLEKDLPKVRGDPVNLQHVFINLITNSADAMEGGGVLTISTRLNEPGNRVDILFEDTGHGIKKEYRQRIFDPFFTTKKVGVGTGLGLSVCHCIVSNYGGEITFETVSEEEDSEKKGTTFTVSLPVIPSESE